MASKETEKQTPMMMQYSSIKQNYKDEVVFFRLGDFYEMFNDMPNQMKLAVRKEKLMKIESIYKEED